MSTIDILIAVDTDKLASQVSDGKLSPGTINSPTSLGAWGTSDVFISMLAQHSYATNNQGGSELTVTCKSGDEIQWIIMGFDGNADYTVYLYNGVFNVQNSQQPASNYISSMNYNRITVPNYFPTNNPSGPVSEIDNTIYATEAKLLKYGVTLQYTLSFALIDNSTGTAVGYFSWDPFITIQG
jgi:nematocidal protein AidA